MKRIIPVLFLIVLSACSDKELEAGYAVYQQNCKVCHAQGINGAPVVGRAGSWAPRIRQGEDVLVQHAMEGFGLMPAKGGKTQLQEAEIRLAIRYMVSQSNP